MAREYTKEEVREQFLAHVRNMLDYWERTCPIQGDGASVVRWRLEGLAHSILAALDGCSGALPKFVVAPDPHPQDRTYQSAVGLNWYPMGPDEESATDIAGSLHELLFKKPEPPKPDPVDIAVEAVKRYNARHRGPRIDRSREEEVERRLEYAVRDVVLQVVNERRDPVAIRRFQDAVRDFVVQIVGEREADRDA